MVVELVVEVLFLEVAALALLSAELGVFPLDSRPARDKYCCLNSSVVKAAPVLRIPLDEVVEDSVDALESELADRVDFLKTAPGK